MTRTDKCKCLEKSAWYNDFGIYKCQHCMGVLTNISKVREIIDYNTPVNENGRESVIEKNLDIHRSYLELTHD